MPLVGEAARHGNSSSFRLAVANTAVTAIRTSRKASSHPRFECRMNGTTRVYLFASPVCWLQLSGCLPGISYQNSMPLTSTEQQFGYEIRAYLLYTSTGNWPDVLDDNLSRHNELLTRQKTTVFPSGESNTEQLVSDIRLWIGLLV